MVKNDELKTSPKQRLIVVIVAIFMLLSTFALYAGIVLNYGSNSSSTANKLSSEEQARYDELMAEYNEQVSAQAKELSDKYFDSFKKYKSEVKAYNAASVDNLEKKDLKVGDGEKVSGTNYSAYYIGWLSDETVFDSSFDDFENPTSLKAPLAGSDGLIEGWKQGIEGMKIGGVRLITIPSALGYGDTEQGSIPANSPLKFVIMLTKKADDIPMSEELMSLYYKSMGITFDESETTTEVTEGDTTESSDE